MSESDEQDDDIQTVSTHIFGGGTVFHVRPHLALAAPAYGQTARKISQRLMAPHAIVSQMHMTNMASAGGSGLETNADVAKRVDELVADPTTKMIFMSAALCDFEGQILETVTSFRDSDGLPDVMARPTPSGKDRPRLTTAFPDNEDRNLVPRYQMQLRPSEKIIGRIRKTRKDIFLVGFKTTAGETPEKQYEAGLTLLKKSSCNLVLANDVQTRLNMVITPEQARYHETTNRDEAINGLVEMAVLRSKLHFTRSTVIDSGPVPWGSRSVPGSLRKVVDHCIERGAYKPFLGSTVGHFAVKLDDKRFLTSRRRTNFNDLYNVGLVFVETEGDDKVIAHGSRPSVGGQSQRIVFAEHPDTDCIVHAHVPLRPGAPDRIPVRSQREFECGSHECGKNTSTGLKKFGNLYAVHLQNHGPNIVFHRSIDPQEVISFIERNFDLTRQTGDLGAEPKVTQA